MAIKNLLWSRKRERETERTANVAAKKIDIDSLRSCCCSLLLSFSLKEKKTRQSKAHNNDN